jgi:capsule polysaccharide export protein KpsE/RkpR
VTTATIADESLYPNRPYVIGTAAMVLIMVFFIVSLLVAIIREHS